MKNLAIVTMFTLLCILAAHGRTPSEPIMPPSAGRALLWQAEQYPRLKPAVDGVVADGVVTRAEFEGIQAELLGQ